MKSLRHRFGRWLLRDATHHVSVSVDPAGTRVYADGKAVLDALLRYKRERGGGSLGLS